MAKQQHFSFQTEWEDRFKELKAFKRAHGHCRVPKNWRDHPRLSAWAKQVHNDLSRMSIDQLRRLYDLGWDFGANQNKWFTRYLELAACKENNGLNDDWWPRIRSAHPQLSHWIYLQRRKRGSMFLDRKKLLDRLGFRWLVLQKSPWEKRYEELKAFKQKYGHCRVESYEASHSILKAWCNQQRRSRRQGRVVGSVNQLYQYEYNDLDRVTKEVDPLGRTTIHIYGSNNIDRIETRQVLQNPAGTTNVLAKYTYNTQHLPLTMIDVAGQTNSYTYNSHGQILTSTNPKNETTTYAYDGNGYLTNVTGAVAGAITSYTYDNFGRTYTVTDSEGYTITNNYDSLNRLTRMGYPDGTFVTNVYDKLDLVLTKDRLGRSTRSFYDSARQLVAVQDAKGQTVNYEWCGCGSLEKMIDPTGNKTTWIRDIRSRVTDKIYPDGSVMQYTYDTAGRLVSTKDAKNQFTILKYLPDNDIQQISYSNAVISTPSVSYAYDTNFNRMVTMIDGVGTNTYAYNDITSTPTLGAGRLASIDGQFANDIISYNYDALGRVGSRIINNSTNSMTYDALGRITTTSNPLGTFSNSYVNATARLSQMTYPNGMVLTNSYFGNTNDQQLAEMKYLNSTNGVISKFNYEYNAEEQIVKWTQQTDAVTTNFYNLSYDNVDQLTSADLNSGASVLKRYVYRYNKAGNRTSEQIDTNVTTAVFNNLNQLTNLNSTTGPVRFKGSVNEPATVTLSNASGTVSASVASNGNFNASFTLSSGTNTVSIIAVDYSGNTNTSTNRYQIVMPPAFSTSLAYDLNGNMITNGVKTFSWDAANRLVGVSTSGVQIASFTYDGLSRRTQMVNGTTTNQFLWCGLELCEQRDAAGGTVQKRYFWQGFQNGTTNLFYTRDHLGSIREAVDSTGTNLLARYDFDLYGRRTLVSGTDLSDFGFTGHYFHKQSGLTLVPYRTYDADLGRWLNRDPIGEFGGLNLYGYVGNNPLNATDPFGLWKYYGNWGGPDWTGGQTKPYEDLTPEEQKKLKPPIDKQDECYKQHDLCYSRCRVKTKCTDKDKPSDEDQKNFEECRKKCDLLLSSCLNKINNSPDGSSGKNTHSKSAENVFDFKGSEIHYWY